MLLVDHGEIAVVLATGERIGFNPNLVRPLSGGAIRRTVYKRAAGVFTPTHEIVPVDYQLPAWQGTVKGSFGTFSPIAYPAMSVFDATLLAYHTSNNWHYDWPHRATERAGDTNDALAVMMEKIARQVHAVPYEVGVTALERRFLLYYSDGNIATQSRFITYCPRPARRSPFNEAGELATAFLPDWTPERLAKQSFHRPSEYGLFGHESCLLYAGPAWCFRFTLDDQDLLTGGCRVWLTDDAEFIASDWCQRHDVTSYKHGINLQVMQWSLESWIMGPLLTHTAESGIKFKPKHASVGQVIRLDTIEKEEAERHKALDEELSTLELALRMGVWSQPFLSMASPLATGGSTLIAYDPTREGRKSTEHPRVMSVIAKQATAYEDWIGPGHAFRHPDYAFILSYAWLEYGSSGLFRPEGTVFQPFAPWDESRRLPPSMPEPLRVLFTEYLDAVIETMAVAARSWNHPFTCIQWAPAWSPLKPLFQEGILRERRRRPNALVPAMIPVDAAVDKLFSAELTQAQFRSYVAAQRNDIISIRDRRKQELRQMELVERQRYEQQMARKMSL